MCAWVGHEVEDPTFLLLVLLFGCCAGRVSLVYVIDSRTKWHMYRLELEKWKWEGKLCWCEVNWKLISQLGSANM